MKKLIFGVALLAAVAMTMAKAESVELVKISSYNTGYVTGTYDEYPTWGVKIGSKIIINDAYSTLNIDSRPDGTGYKYDIKPKQNLSICIYDADKNEYCDYQNLNIIKTDTGAADYSYPSKVILEYKGTKLPKMDLFAMSGLTTAGTNYLGYDQYYSGYFSKTGTVADILGEKLFLNNIDPKVNSYYDQSNGIYTSNGDIYKANQTTSFYSPKYMGIGLSSLTSGELADLINGTNGNYINQTTTVDPEFAKYFAEYKDQTVIASQNLKLDNTDKFWIKPQGNSYSQDLYTNARKDYNTSVGISLMGYMGNLNQYYSYLDANIYTSEYYTNTKSEYSDNNGKKRVIVKSVRKPEPFMNIMPVSTSATTDLPVQDPNTYITYSAITTANDKNILTININVTTTGADNGQTILQNAINSVSVKKALSFSMPKELGINILKPQDSNYFITRMGDAQYPQYSIINTTSTGGSIYVYKNQYTNVKAYIKGQEKDYKYVINSNNSPIYIKNTKYENTNQFDILVPVKETDGTDSTINMSTYTTKSSEINDLKNLLDKALYTTVKITKTKKNAKEFDKNVVNYFKNLK